jgi:prevent-host-death family protein
VTKLVHYGEGVATVNVHEAKTQLSRLLARVEGGESIIIARKGRPVARLVPIVAKRRVFGRLKGKIRYAEDLAAPLPDDLVRLFYGEGG